MHKPVMIATSQYNGKENIGHNSPFSLVMKAIDMALEDSARPKELLGLLDAIALISTFEDYACALSQQTWQSYGSNPPARIAQALGVNVNHLYYSGMGGHMPQSSVGFFANQIAQGKLKAVLLAGAEAMATDKVRQKKQTNQETNSNNTACSILGSFDPIVSFEEFKYRFLSPATGGYAMFENAYRFQKQHSIAQNSLESASLFSDFSKQASLRSDAWIRDEKSIEALLDVQKDNRMIAFPYPKYLNAFNAVDLSAALIMTSDTIAQKIGIPKEKRVYLHASCDAKEPVSLLERKNFFESPAKQQVAKCVLKKAHLSIQDIAAFDLYSCFPIAVKLDLEALGISLDDKRLFSLTGGLPYYGAAGNNYAMHGIVSMIDYLRDHKTEFGLVSANGGILSKQSMGIYSRIRPEHDVFTDVDLTKNKQKNPYKVAIQNKPKGEAMIETYSILYDRKGPTHMVVIAKLTGTKERCIATLNASKDVLLSLSNEECIGKIGYVSPSDELNSFKLTS